MRELFTTQGEPVFVATRYTNKPFPNIISLHRQMEESGALLSTTIKALETSYNEGLAAVLLTDEGQAVGYARMSHLLDREGIESLGLPADFPEILEFGSAFIDPRYRGGIYGDFKNEVLKLILDRIRNRTTLVLGTTKSMAVLVGTEKAKEIGITFGSLVHSDLEMIAPFTCTCNPSFGTGFHRGTECASRITHDEVAHLPEIARQREGRIHCIMTVSDIHLASEMNNSLRAHFRKQDPDNPQKALVRQLLAINHYN